MILRYWDNEILEDLFNLKGLIVVNEHLLAMDPLKLEDIEIYQLALEIGEEVWNMVQKWEYFSKNTVGKQFVEAADSISANIAEGYGRYFYRDRKNFCYYPGFINGN